MPNYTLVIKDKEGNKLRQFSGTRLEVECEFQWAVSSNKWEGCRIYWGTRKGYIREAHQK